MKIETGTLAELGVKPGDVVKVIGGKSWKIEGIDEKGRCLVDDPPVRYLSEDLPFRIVSRASDEDAELTAIAEDRRDGPFVPVDLDEPDTPKMWSKLSDAEKGALLLAAHEGKAIEFYDPEHPADGWMLQVTSKTGVPRHFAYRIKPEPKRETVTLYGYVQSRGYGAQFDDCWKPNEANTHRITFDVVDGKPDCSSVRMEEVGQ